MEKTKQPLYYEDPELLEAQARVIAVHPRGGRLLVQLEPSPFFPGKGGQPADRGTVGGVPIVGYARLPDQEDEGLFPLVEEIPWAKAYPVPPLGEWVECRIDGAWRQEYREQHTGQHLVSGLLKTRLRVDTVSVHFSENTTTIEIAQDTLPSGYRQDIHQSANDLIARNVPVRTYWIEGPDAGDLSLRRVPGKQGPLRVVEIEGVDRTACTGVHLKSLAPLRVALIVGEERIRGRIRLHLLVGRRAVYALERDEELLADLRRLCTAGTEDLRKVVSNLLDEAKTLRQQLVSLKKDLYKLKMKEWIPQGKRLSLPEGQEGVFLPLELTEGEAEDLKGIEEAFGSLTKGLLLVGLLPPGGAEGPVLFLGARSPSSEGPRDLDRYDLKNLLQEPLRRQGGKGGGSGSRFQGSFPSVVQWREFKKSIEQTLALP